MPIFEYPFNFSEDFFHQTIGTLVWTNRSPALKKEAVFIAPAEYHYKTTARLRSSFITIQQLPNLFI